MNTNIPVSECGATVTGLKVSESGGLLRKGVVSFTDSHHHHHTIGWSAKYQGGKEWLVIGNGAQLPTGGTVPNVSIYPFSMDPIINARLPKIIGTWLNEQNGSTAVVVSARNDKPINSSESSPIGQSSAVQSPVQEPVVAPKPPQESAPAGESEPAKVVDPPPESPPTKPIPYVPEVVKPGNPEIYDFKREKKDHELKEKKEKQNSTTRKENTVRRSKTNTSTSRNFASLAEEARKQICQHFNIAPELLLDAESEEARVPRWVMMLIAKEKVNLTYAQARAFVGAKSDAAVPYYCKKARELISQTPGVRSFVKTLCDQLDGRAEAFNITLLKLKIGGGKSGPAKETKKAIRPGRRAARVPFTLPSAVPESTPSSDHTGNGAWPLTGERKLVLEALIWAKRVYLKETPERILETFRTDYPKLNLDDVFAAIGRVGVICGDI